MFQSGGMLAATSKACRARVTLCNPVSFNLRSANRFFDFRSDSKPGPFKTF
jgi:hypothetical protein